MCFVHTHTYRFFPPLLNKTSSSYRSNVMVTICVISEDVRYLPSKHDFWKMPFDKEISPKHITLKCHVTLLTLSGTRVKQLAWSEASRRTQLTAGRRLPEEGNCSQVFMSFSFGCFVINTRPSWKPTGVKISSLNMPLVLLAAVECWVTYKAHL